MTKLEALKNIAQSTGIKDVSVFEWSPTDKRKTVKTYIFSIPQVYTSPMLDYDNMNHFILGFTQAQRLIKLNKVAP